MRKPLHAKGSISPRPTFLAKERAGVLVNAARKDFDIAGAAYNAALASGISNPELRAENAISIKDAAALKSVAASSIRRILYDEALRRAIFPSARFTGSTRRGEWSLSRAEVEAWQPRRPLAKLVKAFVPPTGDPEFSLLLKPLRRRQYTARAENADGSLVVYMTGVVMDDAQIKVIAQAAWLWSIEG